MLSSSLSSSLSELLSSELSLSEGGCRSGKKNPICFTLTRSCAALILHDHAVAEGSQSPHLVTLGQNPGLSYFGADAYLVILLTILYKSTRMNFSTCVRTLRLTVFDNLSSSKQPHYRIGRRDEGNRAQKHAADQTDLLSLVLELPSGLIGVNWGENIIQEQLVSCFRPRLSSVISLNV